jgi:hypothetical protein
MFMKTTLLLMAAVAVAYCSHSQIEVDKPIQLTGGTGERALLNLEAPVNGTDAVNKDYVDNAVSAGGGSSLPTMISTESSSDMTIGDAFRYCRNLTEGTYTDWRLPDMNELTYAVSTGGITVSDDTSINYIWFRVPVTYGSTSTAMWGLRLSDGDVNGYSFSPTASVLRVRCVR